jgi:hypothetical protein
MTQIRVQHFKLDRIPQALPRAAEDPAHNLAPQLTSGFHLLSHLTEDEAVSGGSVPGHQGRASILPFLRGLTTLLFQRRTGVDQEAVCRVSVEHAHELYLQGAIV